jgi:hypothetical protein
MARELDEWDCRCDDCTAERARVARRRNDMPRRSPEPCDPACPGWAVFEVDRCTVHGDACDGYDRGCSTLEIQACNDCWHGQPDPMTDDDYQAHPVCIAQLATERRRNGQA